MEETDQLVATAGNWDGPKVANGSSNITNFQPKTVGSGDDTTIKFSVGFQCTNSGPSVATYGDFTFKFKVVTSAGTFSLDSTDRHRLNFPS
jgi:hypothetical protein